MVSQDRISRLAQQIGDRLQGASQAPEEVQKGVQQVVKGAFDRLELVSREDFDILMDVLQRTRARVEALEVQVAALEEALDRNASPEAEASEPPAALPSEPNPSPEEDAGAGETDR
ncbi:accessory factor UbiK family protein [Halomonas lysinitropha]|uniref:Ubiquinone biosynthesis accessory factor UbiK n=1 Tax=Halomonas lysinitropha TaxID=2607506 RepID=A0A5K1I5B6_9GAMM|nr:accessory factor UbiK family protein [Halomonas lysinitropha]VVZ94372.1 Membrane fusogenic activity [Halomonas lysinitropha]